MRGRVIILLVLIAIVVIGGAAGFLLLSGDETTDPEATTEATGQEQPNDAAATAAASDSGDTGTPLPPIEVAPVVIAQQDLPRGFRLTPDLLTGGSPAVGIALWPVENIPENSFERVEDLENLLVRSDIPRESPILLTQVVADLTALGDVGSDAALLIQPGQVAVSMPLDVSGVGSVAYGLKHGDFIDLILTFLFIEVDETFQSRQPNAISIITRDEFGGLVFSPPLEGRPEPSTLSSLGVLVTPD